MVNQLIAFKYTYLDSKESQIGELLDKSTNLLRLTIGVEPWPALHLDLPQNHIWSLALGCHCGKRVE